MQGLEIWAVRHGETTWNRELRIQGHQDPGLSELGQAQAQALREELQGLPFAAAVSSDLLRAKETARILIEGRGLALRVSKSFRERFFGRLEGLTWPEARARYPHMVKPPQVESGLDTSLGVEDQELEFRPRVLAGLARLREECAGRGPVLLVTHGGVLKVLLKEAEGPGKLFMVPNCALYRFRVAEQLVRIQD